MSAFPPLLGDKLTSGEHAKNDANDPTYDVVARACQMTGRALNLRSHADIQGNYAAIGASGALAAGAGGVQLQNEKGVILQLAGGRVGVELSAAVGGVTVRLE
jgi:hypothetical protein